MALWDLENADCIVVMGSNMAENHPVAFRFVVEAQRRGATIIHVDPRFTRTSALSEIHAPIRPGTDIAFLGGIIRHILENDLWFREWALAYTNIAHIIDERYRDTEDNDGVFSGWDPDAESYKDDTWQYAGKVVPSALAHHRVQTSKKGEGGDYESMTQSAPLKDETLQHPNCVYQILKRHYARYTPEMVEEITGCPQGDLPDGGRRHGQELRTGEDRLLLLCGRLDPPFDRRADHPRRVDHPEPARQRGPAGRRHPGVARGHASIQGSTDIPTLYDMLPGYLTQPVVFHEHATLEDYLRTESPTTGSWADFPKYAVSLLKAWYGEAARKDNDFCYPHLPKLTGDVSQEPMTLAMANGLIKGQFIFGQNPVVGAVNAELVEEGLAKLDWLVVRDFAMVETADFWRDGRRVRKGEISPEEIDTEVFFLPAAMPGEKDGTLTNTSRLVQWHDHVLEAPGDSRSDLWFMYHLGRRLKAHLRRKYARARPADPGSDLGLSGRGRARGAVGGSGAEGDQRPHGR